MIVRVSIIPREDMALPRAARFHFARLACFLVYPLCAFRAWRSDAAVAKVVAYALVVELCGFATMSGPLGAGHTLWTPLWFRCEVGSLKPPAFDGWDRRRSRFDVGLFIAVLACGLDACGTGEASLRASLRRLLGCYAVLCARDRTAYVGAQGAYYGPLLACAAVLGPERAAGGMMAVQACHLLVPGLAKMGPWYAHVSPPAVLSCPFLPEAWAPALRECLYAQDAPTYVAEALADVAALAECAAPILWFGPFRRVGLGVAAATRAWTFLMCPVGAILEWNAVNAIVEFYVLVHVRTPGSALLATPALFVGSLLFLELLLPIAALAFWPDVFTDHFALRKFAGNHPYLTFLASEAAAPKLAAAIPASGPIVAAVVRSGGGGGAGIAARGRLNAKALPYLLRRAAALGGGVGYAPVAPAQWLSQTMLDATCVDGGVTAALAGRADLVAGDLLTLKIGSFRQIIAAGGGFRATWAIEDCAAGPLANGFLETDLLGRAVAVVEDGYSVARTADRRATPVW